MIPTFSNEEMLAPKFRALLQRDKGRDLYDLAHGLDILAPLDCARIVELFGYYLAAGQLQITRAQAEQRMLGKLAKGNMLLDLRPLLSADAAGSLEEDVSDEAVKVIFERLIALLPGEPWSKTPEAKEKLEIEW